MAFGIFGTALAQSTPASATGQGFDIMGLAPILLIGVVMYFLIIRPQQKKMKQHSEMVSSLNRGDRIVTSGGLVGTIHKVGTQNDLSVEICEGVRVKMLKTCVTQVLAKVEPLNLNEDVQTIEATPAPELEATPTPAPAPVVTLKPQVKKVVKPRVKKDQ